MGKQGLMSSIRIVGVFIAVLAVQPAFAADQDSQVTNKKPKKEVAPRLATHLVQRFRQLDTDGNEKLSREEVKKGMPNVLKNFDEMDSNKDGELSMSEFKEEKREQEKTTVPPQHKKLAYRFKQADKDGNEALTKAQAKREFPHLAKFMNQIDENRNNSITLEELTRFLERQRRAPIKPDSELTDQDEQKKD